APGIPLRGRARPAASAAAGRPAAAGATRRDWASRVTEKGGGAASRKLRRSTYGRPKKGHGPRCQGQGPGKFEPKAATIAGGLCDLRTADAPEQAPNETHKK